MLNAYPKTERLLYDLGFDYSSWSAVPENEKSDIYPVFIREIPINDFAEYLSDHYIEQDYAILFSSELDPITAAINFTNERKKYFQQKCDETLDDLFDKSRPAAWHIQQYQHELKTDRLREAA